MALAMQIEMESGVILPEAYIRITEGILSLDRGMAFIKVQTYANKEARDNKKVPVTTHEVRCTNQGSQPKKDAEFEVKVINADVGSGNEFAMSFGQESISLKEGTEITTDGTLEMYINTLIDKLKASKASFDFSFEKLGEDTIIIKPIESGAYTGVKGNELNLSGNAIVSVEKTEGQDRKLSDFEKYFSIQEISLQDKNAILQAYEFIKKLPEYKDATNV